MKPRLTLLLTLGLHVLITNAQPRATIAVTFSGLQVNLISGSNVNAITSGKQVAKNAILEAKGKGSILFINTVSGEGCTLAVTGYKKISMDSVKFVYKSPSVKKGLTTIYNNYMQERPKMVSTSVFKGGNYNYYPMVLPADSERVLAQEIHFYWLKDARVRYEFVMEKGQDLALPIKYTVDTSICFNGIGCTNKLAFEDGQIYYWTIQDSKGDMDSIYLVEFRLATKQEIKAVKDELAQLEEAKDGLSIELYGCLQATIYEAHYMYSEANKIYRTLLNAKDHGLMLEELYQQFILRMAGKNQKRD